MKNDQQTHIQNVKLAKLIYTKHTCDYCGEIKVIVSQGCCEQCNWQLYTQELLEAEWEKEQEDEKEQLQLQKRDINPLNNPYLLESLSEQEIQKLGYKD